MKNLSRAWLALGALVGASGMLSLSAVGCGGDDNGGGSDASGDRTTDVTSDRAGDHVGQTDGGDAANDVATDGGTEADVAPVDAAALYAFPDEVAAAYCKRLAFCCDGADAAAFDLASCEADLVSVGGIANVGLANVHGGHMALDPTSAANCLSDIQALSCGSFTSAEYKAILSDCSLAMVGQLALGSAGCTSSWDCKAPGYCKGAKGALDPIYGSDGGLIGDGGTGTCTEIISAGQPCTDIGFDTDCSYLGNGAPANYCTTTADGGPGTCEADETIGTACVELYQCSSQVCDYVTGECQSSTVFSDPGTPGGICSSFTITDAGGGG